jgi:putative transposase
MEAAVARGRRIVHFSLQDDHLHLILEAADRERIARTIQGFASIVARGFNRVLGRKGKLWEERYHRRDLRTPTEVHRALGYVLQNFRKHASHTEQLEVRMGALDPFSSAAWFDGWDECGGARASELAAKLEAHGFSRCTSPPRTFLLQVGFRRVSLVSARHVPGRSATARSA